MTACEETIMGAPVAADETWVPTVYWRQTSRRKDEYAIELQTFEKYEVSSRGNVRDAATLKPLSVRLVSGRRNIGLYLDGKKHTCKVARLMASSFLGKPPTPAHTADHIDTDGTNDVLTNLRWATESQQSVNRRKYSAPARSVPLLARHLETGETREFESVKEAAAKLDVDVSTVSAVLRGKYAHTGGWHFAVREPPPIEGQVFLEYRKSRVFVGNEGHVRDERKGIVVTREIATYSKNGSYPCIKIGGKELKLHVLVAHLFVPKPPEYKQDSWIAHHIDHDKRNARASNLAWITQSKNISAAHDAGQYDHTASKRKAIEIDGEEFESIRAAARTERFGSHKTIRDRLNNPANAAYVFAR